MVITFDKKDLILEKKGPIDVGLSVCTSEGNVSPCSYLEFEGFAMFNKYAQQVLNILKDQCTGKSSNIFRAIDVTGNLHNDDMTYSATFYIVKNVRDTAFLFKTLKSFGVSLPDLRIGYLNEGGLTTLYLDKKIINIIKSLGETSNELVLYFYCLAKLFKAVEICQPVIGTDPSGNQCIMKDSLTALYIAYGGIDDIFSIDCIQLKEDVCFETVKYLHSTILTFNKLEGVKYPEHFYNVIKTDSDKKLCLINPRIKEFFILDLTKGIVYTNDELKEYNTFDMLEWIPALITNVVKAVPNLSEYTVKYVPLDKLLSSKSPNVLISNDASDYEAFLENYPEISENTDMKIYEGYFKRCTLTTDSAIGGLEAQYADDAYAQELYKQVQDYYKSFNLKDLTGIVKGVANGDIYSMLFEGESGTGKSTAARVIASRCGLPFVAINCSTNIEESDIFGAMIPNPTKSTADDPEFIWQDGPLTKAIRYGYVGIIEELGFGRAGVLGKINSLLDESRQIDLPNGEVLKAHKNFRLIATTNIGYEGTNRLNKALVNRFEICKKFVDLDDKEAKEVIMHRTGYTSVDKITKVLDVYKAIKKYSNEQNLGLVISIRQLLNIFKQGKYYKNAKEAVNVLLLNQAFLEEPEHYKYFSETVLGVYDLTFKL